MTKASLTRRVFKLGLWLITIASATIMAGQACATSRIKDIVNVEGIRTNDLQGYGIVVGLNGTGDTIRNTPELKESLESMFERLGVNVRDAGINSKNVAVVMVTAKLPPFAGKKDFSHVLEVEPFA